MCRLDQNNLTDVKTLIEKAKDSKKRKYGLTLKKAPTKLSL